VTQGAEIVLSFIFTLAFALVFLSSEMNFKYLVAFLTVKNLTALAAMPLHLQVFAAAIGALA
jgi:hypothetical protein